MPPMVAEITLEAAFKALSGETGGLMAIMLISGLAIGWRACMKTMVEDRNRRIAKIEQKLEMLWSEMLRHFLALQNSVPKDLIEKAAPIESAPPWVPPEKTELPRQPSS